MTGATGEGTTDDAPAPPATGRRRELVAAGLFAAAALAVTAVAVQHHAAGHDDPTWAALPDPGSSSADGSYTAPAGTVLIDTGGQGTTTRSLARVPGAQSAVGLALYCQGSGRITVRVDGRWGGAGCDGGAAVAYTWDVPAASADLSGAQPSLVVTAERGTVWRVVATEHP
jgi:hypothetical protein